MFAAPFDHSFNDLFNQYVNLDPSTSGDGNKDVAFTGDLDQFFPVGSLSSDCGNISPGGSRQFLQSPSQTWRKDAWYLQQDSVTGDLPLHRTRACPDTIHPSDASNLGGGNLEESSPPDPLGLLSTSPSTPPTTPRRKLHSKSAPITPKNIRRRETSVNGTLLRKQSFSPSLTRSVHVQKSKMAYPEAWTPRVQRYNNHFRVTEDRLPLSPPPSDILVQNEHLRRDSGVHLSSSAENLLADAAEMASQYGSSLYTAKQQQNAYLNHNNATPPSSDDIFQTPPSSEQQQIHAWHADALASSLQFTPDMNGHDGQWWSSPLPTRVSQAQNQHAYLVSPLPQKAAVNHTVQQQHDLLQGGLMIDFNSSFDLGAHHDAFSATPVVHSTNAPHIPTQHPSSFSHNPYIAMTQQQALGQQSRSPSMSPTNHTSPKSRAAAKSNQHRRTHSRKLSSNSTSAPKPATKLSTSPKGNLSKSTPNVSFVNFTAHDSKKILTGVAPSGSSKTKARREQEARERRRKLSEAALMAVRNAGGDVEALEAVLC
ncbi:developmental regulatory protein weta [Talaromyces proteolyticus]|uniref:Developmental regulatory protein wetA n=1 Tax=Talaromyces proteolyticus TaxID=1131652 RepID=A0AAD4Q3T3_9EURO|nr:developmental regulatory protein weta [Talaromyces proteolyticus]KAH8702066.1 developmental regulatory protein weta [Talaromyces proteolyticus]